MPSPDFPHSPELSPSLSSVESLRSSLPREHQPLFDTLRREVVDFCDRHSIPTSSLNNDDALRESTKHLSIPDLEHLSLLLVRLDHLVRHKEPMPEAEPTDPLEYTEKHYRLREQYTSQVSLLREIGILKEGQIEAIDGHSYPVPTLEQIAERLYERREELGVKHDQGFTKLVLVPFGMSLDILQETLKRFLISYKKSHPDFELDVDDPVWISSNDFIKADIRRMFEGSPFLVYYPTSFDSKQHQGKTKAQTLEEQATNPDSFPGWTIHLFQPTSFHSDEPFPQGIAPTPQEDRRRRVYHRGFQKPDTIHRPNLKSDTSPADYLSSLMRAKDNPDSPYHLETGLTFEDWIIAFMTHLRETGEPLDDSSNPSKNESSCFLLGSFFPSSTRVLAVNWDCESLQVCLSKQDPDPPLYLNGSRFSVRI